MRMEPRIRGRKYVSNKLDDELQSAPGDAIELRRERNARYVTMLMDFDAQASEDVPIVYCIVLMVCRLIQAFGSQRRKKQLLNAQAGRVDASQLTSGEAMLHLIRSTKADPGIRAEVIKESLSHRNIPPHNSKATTADEAYPFDQIVPKIVRDALDTSLLEKACQDNSVLSEITKVHGPYVASRVAGSTLINSSSSSHLDRTNCLVFLGYLLKFASDMGKLVIRVKTEKGGIQVVAEKFHMTTSLLEGILDLFYSREDMDDGSKYILDKTKRNLMLTWCLLLAIRAEPESTLPSFAFQTLCDQLKMKPVDVAAIFRELGCLTKRAPGGYIVTLLKSSLDEDSKTLEDSFPPLKLGGKKR